MLTDDEEFQAPDRLRFWNALHQETPSAEVRDYAAMFNYAILGRHMQSAERHRLYAGDLGAPSAIEEKKINDYANARIDEEKQERAAGIYGPQPGLVEELNRRY